MQVEPIEPQGRPIAADSYFTLMAGDDGIAYVHCGDGVLVVPLSAEKDVLLAVEHSPAFDREVLVLPGGSVESGEGLEVTANRELQEELGWRASRLDYLGELTPFKYLTSRQFVFLARDLAPLKLPGDEARPVGARSVALEDVLDLVTLGHLHDAPTIAALCLTRLHLKLEARAEGETG